MAKIGSYFIQKHLPSSSDADSSETKNKDYNIQVAPSFGAPYRSYQVRTLKAVYPHFAQAKKKAKEIPDNFDETLTGEDLKNAMEEAKSKYQMMRDIQEQLNQAYKELLLLNSET